MKPSSFGTRVGCIAVCLALFSGCSFPVFTEPVTITTKHFASFGEQAEKAPLVSGRSCSRVTLLFIPLGFGTATAAFDDALSNAQGADTLVDWHMKQDTLAIVGTLLYFENCITVEGKAIDSQDLVASAGPDSGAEAYVRHWQLERTRAEKAADDGAVELARSGGGTKVTRARPAF